MRTQAVQNVPQTQVRRGDRRIVAHTQSGIRQSPADAPDFPKVRLAAAMWLGLEGEWHNVLARLSECSAPSSRQPLRRNGSSAADSKFRPTASAAPADVSLTAASNRFGCCLIGGNLPRNSSVHGSSTIAREISSYSGDRPFASIFREGTIPPR